MLVLEDSTVHYATTLTTLEEESNKSLRYPFKSIEVNAFHLHYICAMRYFLQ